MIWERVDTSRARQRGMRVADRLVVLLVLRSEMDRKEKGREGKGTNGMVYEA